MATLKEQAKEIEKTLEKEFSSCNRSKWNLDELDNFLDTIHDFVSDVQEARIVDTDSEYIFHIVMCNTSPTDTVPAPKIFHTYGEAEKMAVKSAKKQGKSFYVMKSASRVDPPVQPNVKITYLD